MAIFSDETVFPCAKGAAGENGKETLLRKASEADAHVVSFGTRVGGLRPSDTSHRVYRQSGQRFESAAFTIAASFFDSG